MSILFPAGLLALLALPIIILLHLRRERLRRVTVPSLMLWHNLPRPQQGEKRRRLPLTLLLLLHLLAAALIGFALSQPQWLQGEPEGEQHLAVVIDTSTSMRANSFLNESRFERARNRTRSLISSMGERDTIALIAAGSEARLLASGGWSNSSGLLAALDALEAGGTGTDMAGALTMAQVALQNRVNTGAGGTQRIMVYSDADAPQAPPLPGDLVEWVTMGGNSSNRAIVALSARPRTGQNETTYDVYARIANYSNEPQSLSVKFFGYDANQRLLDSESNMVMMNPESETEMSWNVGGGLDVVQVELDHQDTLPADNIAHLSLSQARPLRVLLVTETPAPPADGDGATDDTGEAAQPATMLERALRAIPGIALEVRTPTDYAAAPSSQPADLTIFNHTTPTAWPPGGVLVINPPPESSLLSVATPISTDGMRVVIPPATATAGASPENLNLESVNFNPVLVVQPPEWAEVAVALEDDMGEQYPLILRGSSEQSEIAIWAFDLNTINLTTRLAFPLLVAHTVRDLTPPPPPASLTWGEALQFQPDPRTSTVEVQAPDGQTWQVEPMTGTVQLPPLRQTGLYNITEQQGSATIYATRVAVNAGTPLESNLQPRPLSTDLAINPITAPERGTSTSAQAPEPAGQPLWPWLALAALAVIVLEWLYIHR